MRNKNICLAFFLLVAGMVVGCESKTDLNKSESSKAAPSTREMGPHGLPADWTDVASIRISKIESPEGKLTVTLAGEKQRFSSILDQIRSNVSKPINFSKEVDPEQELSEFEIKMEAGSWQKLLTLVAEKFNCVVEESDSEFLIVPRK
ncbi:MAG: hypothetical protein R3C03_21545 [Pirellulaceae bacterium]